MSNRIEKGIPLKKNVRSKYRFSEMEVGDSFFCEVENESSFRVYCYQRAKVYGIKLSVGVDDRDGKRGLRVWRTA